MGWIYSVFKWLRAIAAFVEELDLVPGTKLVIHNHL